MFVTTSYHPTSSELELAKRLAGRLSCRFVERRQSSIQRLQRQYGEQDHVVVTTEGARYFPLGSAHPFFFHPSTAQVRLKRLLQDEPDALIVSTGVQPGDVVIDCTAGLGSESILLSYGSGVAGRVTALESEPMVALLVEEGLKTYCSGLQVIDDAMRRIKVHCADHLDYLRQLADDSADIVYFDPMFRKTIDETSSIVPLKAIANYGELRQEAVAQACRVARRRVVLKENRDGQEFERLGFRMTYRQNTKIAYGVIDV